MGRGRRHLAVERHVRDRATTPTAATRPGSTRSSNQLKNTSASRRRHAVPDLRRAPRPRSTTAPITTAFRTGWQVDYPSLYNFLGAALRAPVPARTTATTRTPSSTRCSTRAPPRPSVEDGDREVPAGSGDPLRGPPGHPAVVLERAPAPAASTVENVEFGWDIGRCYYEITKSE